MTRGFMMVCLALGASQAATLPYQGLATDAKGNPKADASYRVDFALYPSANGVSPLWSESQQLSTRKGLFSSMLGSETVIPDSLFNGSPLYLGVRFDGGSEGARALVGTTPWATSSATALRAAYADSAGKVAGFKDSLAALRSKIASLDSAVVALKLRQSEDSVRWSNAESQFLTDTRDGRRYPIVRIGSQRWMARNLNFKPAGADSGVCNANDPTNCSKYGRQYSWSQVMAGSESSEKVPSGVQGICPDGWHVPSANEWYELERVSNAYGVDVRVALAATSPAWEGEDRFGFAALPGGFDGRGIGTTAKWWTSTALAGGVFGAPPGSLAIPVEIDFRMYTFTGIVETRTWTLSLRCIED
jgi:uncharacterized protein (TIGR02145 family)